MGGAWRYRFWEFWAGGWVALVLYAAFATRTIIGSWPSQREVAFNRSEVARAVTNPAKRNARPNRGRAFAAGSASGSCTYHRLR